MGEQPSFDEEKPEQKPEKRVSASTVIRDLQEKASAIQRSEREHKPKQAEELASTSTEQLDYKIAQIEQRMRPIERTKQGYGYTYATLTELLGHVLPAFKEFKLSWTSWSDTADFNGSLYNVFTVQVSDLESGQHRESVHVYTLQSDAQKVGSFETYFRRYSLISLLGLPIKDDDGQATARRSVNRYQNRK